MFALFTKLYVTELSDPGYIEYGAGDFDGQNSGHDFYGVSIYHARILAPQLIEYLLFILAKASFLSFLYDQIIYYDLIMIFADSLDAAHRLREQLRRWPLAHLLRLPVCLDFFDMLKWLF
jgi:hypothetical protein